MNDLTDANESMSPSVDRRLESIDKQLASIRLMVAVLLTLATIGFLIFFSK